VVSLWWSLTGGGRGRRERKRVPVLFRDTLQLERVEPSEAMSIAKQFTTHGKKVTTV
jgi:hypothetical protein